MTEEIMTLMIMMINVRSATLEELGQTISCLSMSVAAPVRYLCYFCSSERSEERGRGAVGILRCSVVTSEVLVGERIRRGDRN